MSASERGYVQYLRAQYEAAPGWTAEHRAWVRRFGIAGAVLDAGSGFGHLAAACAEVGARVIGVERDWSLVAVARSTTGFGGSVCGDVTALPLRDGAFDWVLSNQVIEHLSDPMAFLLECRRVLRPQGYLFLTTPNRRSHLATRRPAKLLAALRGLAKSDPTHIHEFVPAELVALVQRAGFEVTHREAIGRLSKRRWTRFLAGGTLLIARPGAGEASLPTTLGTSPARGR